ncbi:aldehyde dehydrogenase family protein [Rhodoferax sp. WC2427]|uniref:L-piperidine-6-carboxylate dehydrogenase n=1 Tax=Rhodoferax sp. WC2427 TaxID=3234144 RepID=UPI0034673005
MPATPSLPTEVDQLLQRLGVPRATYTGGPLAVRSPITGETIAHLPQTSPTEATAAIARAQAAYLAWRTVPAPRRGELVRLLGEELRAAKADLGLLVTLEVGKVPSEGAGEVQEMIDICDFAVGLSRQLYGLTIATERAEHRMMETWHPMGVVGVISAFNFPVAVWCWNAALALVCGNAVVWKPSEKTPLTALATMAIAQRALARFGDAPEGLLALLVGPRDIGEVLVDDARVKVLSATGSTAMGKAVAPRVAARFARAILELGGNNAAIVAPSADLDLSLRGIAFAAMGTAGQRCTTLRRLFVHDSVYDALVPQLAQVYGKVQVGDPRAPGTLVGPLIDRAAFDGMQKALEESRALGARMHGGTRVESEPEAFYVRPALVELADHAGPVLRETFAPILYVLRYQSLDQAIDWHNAVGAGLSSSIFTLNMREAERFMASNGSDCGIANVNIGPSGAEIGGAFGGEKETGGGRESGSDSWKAYMRRATNTINYSTQLPLAQGVKFDV